MTLPRSEPERRRGLQAQLLMPVAIAILLVLMLSALAQELLTGWQEKALIGQRGAIVLESIAQRLQERRQSQQITAQLLADEVNLAAAVGERDKVALSRVLVPVKSTLRLGEISVYADDNRELLHLGAKDPRVLTEPLLASALAGLTHASVIVGSEGLTVLASAPIKGPRGIVGAIIVGSTLGGDTLSEIKDRDGLELAVFQDGSLTSSTLGHPELLRLLGESRLTEQRLVQLSQVIARFHFHATVRPIGDDGLLLALVPTQDLTVASQQRSLLACAGIGVVVCVLALLWLPLARSVTRPLESMVAVTQDMVRGNYQRRVPPSHVRELDDVAGAVNFLAQQLETQRAELARDLAERRRGEAALRTAEQYLRMVIANLPVVVYGVDRQGVFTLSDGAGLASLGLVPGQVVGQSIYEVYRDFPDIIQGATRSLAGELVSVDVEVAGITFESRFAPLKDGTGDIVGMIGIGTDVTDRKVAECKLGATLNELVEQYREAERARSETRAVLDAANEAMVLFSPDLRVQMINERFSTLFGMVAADVLARRFDEVQPEMERTFADPARLRALFARAAVEPEQPFKEDVAQRWPEPRELELFSTPVRGHHGQQLGRLWVFRDVTHEREVDRMKSEFVSLVSHELRTPLTSIKGYVDLLLAGEVGELDQEQQEFLTIVKNNADREVMLINDLLDISRIDAGKVELRQSIVDLAGLAQHVASSLRPQLEAKGQQLTLDLPVELPAVWGDGDRVTQILTNLLSNAHKYTPPGGSITISARGAAGEVRIDVRDTGIGLTSDDQVQLFTKFFRAHNRTTQEVGGTGLGLAITRSLVELHGGQLTVTSAPGQGSTFSVTLPAVAAGACKPEAIERPPRATAAPEAAIGTAMRRGTGERILVVDDEPDIAQLIKRSLERGGYEVLLVSTAAGALQQAQAEQPDLIVLDVMLPDSDGFTTLEWLKQNLHTAAIPVILLSIVPDNGRGRLLDAADYLTKPVEERVLLERVRRAIDGSRARVVPDAAPAHFPLVLATGSGASSAPLMGAALT